MRFEFHKSFKKQFRKLPLKIQAKFNQRFLLFCSNPNHKLLDMHELGGKLAGLYSINITGDHRAQFYYKGSELIVFLHIGTHSQLYG